ncbi:MAG: glycosyltransferase family 4 protein [Nitrososphaerota archaeon]|jgi:glycosyltransferase involved in cell wall biosynthesis|nr:glycosyltransferase family 4 protein [Nitrososphaerota archaeon]
MTPPEGYTFLASTVGMNKLWGPLSRFGPSFEIQRIFSDYLPLPLIKGQLETVRKIPKNIDLTYSLDHCVFREEAWVLEVTFELPFTLAGSERQLVNQLGTVKQLLNSRNCKKIAFQLEVAKDAFVRILGDFVNQKAELIPRGGNPRYFERVEGDGKVRLLFVNSSNILSNYSFYSKGGPEVIAAYLKLRKQFDNIELVVRSRLPRSYRSLLSGLSDVKLIEDTISWTDLDSEWKSADIFVHPHFTTPSYAIIDAMSYGLPVVSTCNWGMPEIVKDGFHGYLVQSNLVREYTEGPLIHNYGGEFRKEVLKGPQEDVVEGLVARLGQLIENPNLRRRLGDAARTEVAIGSHSVSRRNKTLKRLLDEAI